MNSPYRTPQNDPNYKYYLSCKHPSSFISLRLSERRLLCAKDTIGWLWFVLRWVWVILDHFLVSSVWWWSLGWQQRDCGPFLRTQRWNSIDSCGCSWYIWGSPLCSRIEVVWYNIHKYNLIRKCSAESSFQIWLCSTLFLRIDQVTAWQWKFITVV